MHQLPERYRNLLSPPGIATISVLARDGTIQSTLVWTDFDGELLKFNMVCDSPKARNIQREGRATVLATDSLDENFYVSLRCELHEASHEGAIEHLNRLTLQNMGKSRWYGDVEPFNAAEEARRVVVYLRPVRVYYT